MRARRDRTLCVRPQGIHLFEIGLGRRFATRRQEILDDLEPLLEAQRRIDERILGVDVDLAGEVDAREQEVAELGVDLGLSLRVDRLGIARR